VEFPHESTTDQWFGESQLESYRVLGLHAVEVICGKDWKPSTLPRFFEKVKKTSLPPRHDKSNRDARQNFLATRGPTRLTHFIQ
jgi:hypothetical protein